jgi:hypothetical protein
MHMNPRSVGTVAVVAALFFLTGCAAVVVGGAAATGVFYYQGELKADLEATPKQVMAATQDAFNYFEWKTTKFNSTRTDGTAVARTGTDKEIQVVVIGESDRITKARIRVGTFGDERLSRKLLEKIRLYIESDIQRT